VSPPACHGNIPCHSGLWPASSNAHNGSSASSGTRCRQARSACVRRGGETRRGRHRSARAARRFRRIPDAAAPGPPGRACRGCDCHWEFWRYRTGWRSWSDLPWYSTCCAGGTLTSVAMSCLELSLMGQERRALHEEHREGRHADVGHAIGRVRTSALVRQPVQAASQ
jgi:hypothetical protein